MRIKLLFAAVPLFLAPAALAGQYSLNEWCFYVNSLDLNHSCAEAGFAGMIAGPFQNVSFDATLGSGNTLGTVDVSLNAGTYSVFAIWSYDLTGGSDGFNQYAIAVGSLPAGVSYGVDSASGAPGSGGSGSGGSGSGENAGFASGNLNDTNYCATPGSCEDPAVALGYTVTVPPGDAATVVFTAGSTPPSSGFYVSETDPGSGTSVYLSVTDPIAGPDPVPEPVSSALVIGGLGLLYWRRRRTA